MPIRKLAHSALNPNAAQHGAGPARCPVSANAPQLQDEPDDYVIATGIQHSVREFVDAAAAELGLRIEWRGTGNDEVGILAEVSSTCAAKPGDRIVAIDPRYFRPAEVDTLLGDSSKARERLKWEPRTTFRELVGEMVKTDLELAKRDRLVQKAGFKAFNYHE